MKAVILAGGLGTRLQEETERTPKPMVEIGGRPLLWHIMKMYSRHNVNEFIICCGYKANVIKDYFSNYFLYMSDVTFDMSLNRMEVHSKYAEPWRITLVDTGQDTMTGGRLLRVRSYLKDEESFCLTYGDGVSDIDLGAEIVFHQRHKRMATVAAVQLPGRYGALNIDGNAVAEFNEKPHGDGGWINGGFFVLSPQVFDYIESDRTSWESTPLDRLAEENQLMAFQHRGFWREMDTLRDKTQLEELWQSGAPPWKTWA
jgi:glucose-1-phosphate cytidylyltransferase